VGTTWSALLIAVAAGSPWLVAIAYYWRRRPRDGFVPPSAGEMARKRLWLS
jgi:hypothetical protein